jgi:ABC-type transport system involved in multi-copper enzyme maturation permease subunit
MDVIRYVAVNVFRESVRDRVPYNLVLFAILLMGASYLIGQLTAGQDVKIIKDLGLAAISIFGLFIAVFIGIGLVSKEVERRSIFALLAKPVSRSQFIAGKYLGLVFTLAANVAVMVVAMYAVLAYLGWNQSELARAAKTIPVTDPAMLKAVLLIFVELMLVTAVALFFSTFSTPMLSAALTVGLYIAGHFNADLRNFDQVVDAPAAVWLARGLYHVLPDLSAFDVKAQVVHGLPVTAGYLAWTIGYGLAYIAGLLVASTVIFSRRDFK